MLAAAYRRRVRALVTVRLATKRRPRSARPGAGRGRRGQSPRASTRVSGHGGPFTSEPFLPGGRKDQQRAFWCHQRADVLRRDRVLLWRHRLHGETLDDQVEHYPATHEEGPGRPQRGSSPRWPDTSAALQRSRSARSRTPWSEIPARQGTRRQLRSHTRRPAPRGHLLPGSAPRPTPRAVDEGRRSPRAAWLHPPPRPRTSPRTCRMARSPRLETTDRRDSRYPVEPERRQEELLSESVSGPALPIPPGQRQRRSAIEHVASRWR